MYVPIVYGFLPEINVFVFVFVFVTTYPDTGQVVTKITHFRIAGEFLNRSKLLSCQRQRVLTYLPHIIGTRLNAWLITYLWHNKLYEVS